MFEVPRINWQFYIPGNLPPNGGKPSLGNPVRLVSRKNSSQIEPASRLLWIPSCWNSYHFDKVIRLNSTCKNLNRSSVFFISQKNVRPFFWTTNPIENYNLTPFSPGGGPRSVSCWGRTWCPTSKTCRHGTPRCTSAPIRGLDIPWRIGEGFGFF